MGIAPAGGMVPAGGMAPTAGTNLPVIGKRGSKSMREKEQEQAPQAQQIKLTSLEHKLYKMLLSMKIKHPLFGQYSVNVPGEQRPFSIDFAYPDIGVATECLHPDTYISTIEGVKKAREIKMGEKLIGRKGEPVEIIRKIVNKSKGKLVHIKALGINKIRATGNHPFLICKPKRIRVKRKEPRITRTRDYYIPYNPIFVNASDIEKGDYLVVPKNRQISNSYKIKNKLNLSKYQRKHRNAHRLPNIVELNEEFGWLMGIYAAEGCSSGKKSKSVSFSFHIDEVEYSNKVKYLLKKIFNLNSSEYIMVKNNCRKVNCYCTSLGNFLKESFGHKAPNKKLPQWMFEAPVECKEEFMKGFCEGDGCIRPENGVNRYISSSEKLLIDIQALSFSIGKFATMCQSRKPGKVLIFGNSEKSHISAGLWEVDMNPNECKNKQYREDDDYFYVLVKNIEEEEYYGDVINFETKGNGDNNHTYLVNNVVTHNCDGEIWHEREDFKQRDLNRDQKLANIGWRILRFREDAIEEQPDAVRDIIYKNVVEAEKAHKKASQDNQIIKYSSVNDNNKNPVYDFITNNKDNKIGCYTKIISDKIQILYIGTVANGD